MKDPGELLYLLAQKLVARLSGRVRLKDGSMARHYLLVEL